MDLKKLFHDVRAMEASLPRQKIYYMVSLDNPDKDITGGRVMDVNSPRLAAELIVGRTHKLASEEDIARFQADEKRNADELAAIEYKRKGQLAMPSEMSDLVKVVLLREEAALDAANKRKEKDK